MSNDYTLEQLEKVLTSVLNTAADETRKGNKGLGDQIKSLQSVIGDLRKTIKESDESKAIHDLASAARESLAEARRNARNGRRQNHSDEIGETINRNMRSLFQDLRRNQNQKRHSNNNNQGPLNIDFDTLNKNTGTTSTAFGMLSKIVGVAGGKFLGLMKTTDSVDGSFKGLVATLGLANSVVAFLGDRADMDVNAYRMIMQSAEGTISSMTQLNTVAADAGMNVKQFAEAMRNGTASAKMLGGVAFSGLIRTVRDSNDVMAMLGYDSKDAVENLNSYLEMQRMGMGLDTMDMGKVESSLQEMIKTDRKIAELMGVATEDIRKQKEIALNDSQYQLGTQDLLKDQKDASDAMKVALSKLPGGKDLEMIFSSAMTNDAGVPTNIDPETMARAAATGMVPELLELAKRIRGGDQSSYDAANNMLMLRQQSESFLGPMGQKILSWNSNLKGSADAVYGMKQLHDANVSQQRDLKEIERKGKAEGLSDQEIQNRKNAYIENTNKARDPKSQATADPATKSLLSFTFALEEFRARQEQILNQAFLNAVGKASPAIDAFGEGLHKMADIMKNMSMSGPTMDIAGTGLLTMLAGGAAIAAITAVAGVVVQGLAAAKMWNIMRSLSAAGGAAQGGGMLSRLFGGGAQAAAGAGAASGGAAAAQSAGLLSKLGNFAKVAGKFAGVAGGAYGLYDGISTVADNRNESFLGQKEGEGGFWNSRASGYGSAALGGAAVGGAIGSAFFGIGAAPGAAIGAGIGAGGAFAADQWQNMKDWWNGSSQPQDGQQQNQPNQQASQQVDPSTGNFDYARMASMFGEVMVSVLNNSFIKIDPSNWLPTVERHQVEHNELLRTLNNAISPPQTTVRTPTGPNTGRTVTVPVQQAPGLSPFTPRTPSGNNRTPELTPDEYMTQTVELQKTQTRTVQELVTSQRELRMAFEQTQAMMLQLLQQIESNTRKAGQTGPV